MKVKVTIPSELNEITLGQYLKFQEVLEQSEDDGFIMLKMVSIFCTLPLKQTAQLPLVELEDIFNHLNKTFEQKPKFKNRFFLDGKEFGFIPKLDDMTYGEFIDVSNYLSNVRDFNKLMAVLYRPINKKAADLYDIEEYEGSDRYSHVMRSAPLDVCLAAQVFFYNLGNESLTLIAEYLKKEATTLATKQTLAESGDSIREFTQSLKETYLTLKQLQRKVFTNV